jgi:hypothetical protein
MRTFNIVIERDPDTRLYVGHVPGWPGAHSQGDTLDELRRNLQEGISRGRKPSAEARGRRDRRCGWSGGSHPRFRGRRSGERKRAP